MNVGEEESEAISRATNQVATMLQRSDQLQKVEQIKRRIQRKKASVEAMLKTAMQSQLDGVRTGLNQLQTALVDLKEIRKGLGDIEENLKEVPGLSSSLVKCRGEYLKHSQYAAAMENLKHIFTVPDSVEKTRLCISEGKLLNAHQCITDLENSRDDLLFELFKLPNQNPNETRLLKECFQEVNTLSVELGKQLWIILHRTLNTVRKEPTQIVTALRIIEREENADHYAMLRQKTNGFLPPGRPKQWRKEAMAVLEKAVAQRIEGNQMEGRDIDKNWLIRHLEAIRLMLLEDLKVVKTQCVDCFPPSYDIVNTFVDFYHRNLSSHLMVKVEEGLEENEHVTILSWVLNTYPGRDLIGSKSLNLDTSRLKPLLSDKVLKDLHDHYKETVTGNYRVWMGRALDLEQTEWRRLEPPQQDSEGHFKTELPQIIHDMIKQNLEVAATISPEVQMQILGISLSEVATFAGRLRGAITDYKDNYFHDRSKIQYYTTYMIALANSCQSFMEVMSQIKQEYYKPATFSQHDKKVATHYEEIMKAYQRLREIICDYLMEEALIDLKEQFNALLTQQWITNTEPMDTICLTIKDYFQDYTHLHPTNYKHIVGMALNTVATRYIAAIMQRKMSLKSDDARRQVGERIIADAENLKQVFDSIAPDMYKYNSQCEAIKALTDVLTASDMDFLNLETHRLLSRYPDMTTEQLSALLSLRGDIGFLDIRQRVNDSFEEVQKQKPGTVSTKSIFSQVVISSSIIF